MSDRVWLRATGRHLAAALDMLDNALVACPEPLWAAARPGQPQYWHLAYHTLFFLDYYLSPTPEGFAPPEPFDLAELDPAGVMPPRVYTREELRGYLAFCRTKVAAALAGLGGDAAARPHPFPSPVANLAELVLMNLRHVQHHTAQLNLLLRQTVDDAPRWVGVTELPPAPDPQSA